MKILVTGAGGFVGRHLVQSLPGHDVLVLARTPVAGQETIVANLSSFDPTHLPTDVDAVIHLAQSREYRNFPAGAADMFAINTASTAALIRWAADTGVQQFTFASTGSVYEPFTGSMHEDAHVTPTNYYPASKLAAEQLLAPYADSVNISVLRLFFVYGPTQTGMLIANLIDGVRNGNTFTVPKDGQGLVFVPTYVDDVVRVTSQATTNGWTGTYNVAQPQPVDFRTLLNIIGEALGVEPSVTVTNDEVPSAVVPDLNRLAAKIELNQMLDVSAGIGNTVASANLN